MADMNKPSVKPRWATDVGAAVVTPPSGKQDSGWVVEYPPHEFFNWLSLWTYNWINYFEAKTDAALGSGAETTLTIASGSVTPTQANHRVDTEASAASDDLTNIQVTNLADGRILILRTVSAARVVTVKHNAGGSGSIQLSNAADIILDSPTKFLTLMRSGTSWIEMSMVNGRGMFRADAGTAASPSFSSSGDTDTGLLFPAANSLGIALGGFEQFRFVGQQIQRKSTTDVATSMDFDFPDNSTSQTTFGIFRFTNTSSTQPSLVIYKATNTGDIQHRLLAKDGQTSYLANGTSSKLAIGKTTATEQLEVLGNIRTDGKFLAAAGTAALPSVSFTSAANAGLSYVGALILSNNGAGFLKGGSTGNLTVGGDLIASDQVGVYLRRAITGAGGTTGYGIFVGQSATSLDIDGVMTTANGVATELGDNTGSATLTTLNHYCAAQKTFGTNTVTNQTGFRVFGSLVGASTNYAFKGEIPASASNWNVFMDGTAQNYFAGNVGIGVTTPSTLLHVSGASTVPKIRIQRTAGGAATATQDGDGIELLMGEANTTNKYTPFIKFGSTDSAFTTPGTNPRFGAAIAGYATELYNADNQGGMGLEFFTTPNNPGAAGNFLSAFKLNQNQQAEFNAGSGALPSIAFTNGVTSGFFSPEANRIGVSISGAERFRFTTENIERRTGADINQAFCVDFPDASTAWAEFRFFRNFTNTNDTTAVVINKANNSSAFQHRFPARDGQIAVLANGTLSKVAIGKTSVTDTANRLEVAGNSRVEGDLVVTGAVSGTFAGAIPLGGVIATFPHLSAFNAYVCSATTAADTAGFVQCNGQLISDGTSLMNGATIPNLNDDVFIMGNVTSGTAAGANTKTIAEANLPAHVHVMTHGHANTFALTNPTSASSTHTHDMTHIHQVAYSNGASLTMQTATGATNTTWTTASGTAQGAVTNLTGTSGSGDTWAFVNGTNTFYTSRSLSAGPSTSKDSTGAPSATVTTTLGGAVTNFTGNTGSVGSGTALDIRPKYITARYVMRIK